MFSQQGVSRDWALKSYLKIKRGKLCSEILQEKQKIEGRETEGLIWQKTKQKCTAEIRKRFKKESEVFRWQRSLSKEMFHFGNVSFSLIDNTPYPQLH